MKTIRRLIYSEVLRAVGFVTNQRDSGGLVQLASGDLGRVQFNLDVRRNSVLVADGGLNLVGKLKKDGTTATIAVNPISRARRPTANS